MQLMPHGDYYIWYCEWCDTRNMTSWVRIEKNQLCCAACHKHFSAFEEAPLAPVADTPGQYRMFR